MSAHVARPLPAEIDFAIRCRGGSAASSGLEAKAPKQRETPDTNDALAEVSTLGSTDVSVGGFAVSL